MPIDTPEDQKLVDMLVGLPGDLDRRVVVLGDGSTVERTGDGPRIYRPPDSRSMRTAARTLLAAAQGGDQVPRLTPVNPEKE